MKKIFIFLGVLVLVCGCGKYKDKDLLDGLTVGTSTSSNVEKDEIKAREYYDKFNNM